MDKPDYSKMEEFMVEYENEYLATLSNTQWLLYPFLKTFRVIGRKIGICRKDADDYGKSNKKNSDKED